MWQRYILFLMLTMFSTNVFADGGVLTILNTFPNDGLMLENHVYKNAAVFKNIGVYDGMVDAFAIYEDASIYCNPGYYLPINTDKCAICTENNYCIGGEYVFNETTPQGISQCPDGLFAGPGTKDTNECGRVLHVGEDVVYLTRVKQTTPALNVQIGNVVFYAKMAPVSDGMKTMNKNTNKTLKVLVNDVEYYVYDNTVQ